MVLNRPDKLQPNQLTVTAPSVGAQSNVYISSTTSAAACGAAAAVPSANDSGTLGMTVYGPSSGDALSIGELVVEANLIHHRLMFEPKGPGLIDAKIGHAVVSRASFFGGVCDVEKLT
jgi:hypothetical protein